MIARKNPDAATDPYAVPYLTGNAFYDYRLGPLCRRLCTKYNLAIEGEPPTPAVVHLPGATGGGALGLEVYAGAEQAVGAAVAKGEAS